MPTGVIATTSSGPDHSAAGGQMVTRVSAWLAFFSGFGFLLVLGFVLYWPSLHGPGFFDDEVMLKGSGGSASLWTALWSQNWLRPETRPLVRFTFDAESAVLGESMAVHRAGNVAVHCLNAVVLLGLILRIQQLTHSDQGNSGRWNPLVFASLVSLLWFVHPLQTAAVAYVAQRCESLMGLFFFLYLRCVTELRVSQQKFWTVAAILAFAAGLSSKTIMVSAPIVGLLLDRAFFARSWRDVLRGQRFLLLVPAAGSVAAICLLLPGILRGEANVGFGGDAPPVALHLAAQSKVLWLYAFQCIWPQWLSVDHSLRIPENCSGQFGWILASAMVLASAGWMMRRGMWKSFFFLVSPLCILSLTSSIIPTADLWVDHRMYAPLAFVITAFVLTFESRCCFPAVWPAAARHGTFIICTIIALLAVRTWFRSCDYRTGGAIWTSALLENPDNDRAIQNLIDAMRKESPESSILPILKQSLRAAEKTEIVPTVILGRIGEQHVQSGDSASAIRVLLQAIRLDNRHFFSGYRSARRNSERFGMQVNMALALASQGELSAALEQVNQAFLFADSSADARALAGSLAMQMNDKSLAQKHFQRALELRPAWKEVEADLQRLRAPD